MDKLFEEASEDLVDAARLWFVKDFESFISDFNYDLLLHLSITIDSAIASHKRNLN